MVAIVTRSGKGAPLTHDEMDTNLTNLKSAVETALATNYPSAVLAASPVAYWRFNDEYGAASYVDSSGNGYNLTPVSGYFTPMPGGIINDTDRGMFMYADGAYATLPTALCSAWPTSSSLSVEAVFKLSPNNSTSYAVILSMSSADSSNNNRIWFCAGNGSALYPAFIVDSASGSDAFVSSPKLLPFGEWVHMVGTYDGTTIKLYINGSLVASATVSVSVSAVARTAAYINRSNWAANTPQQALVLDELALFNSCLTATQVATHARIMRGSAA